MKYVLAQSSLEVLPEYNKNYRGLNVFTMSELIRETGTDKRGNQQSGYVQLPLFCLTPDEREQIMNECTYVQAVISSRMNRISSLEWEITHKKEHQEENYETLKDMKQIYEELDNPGDIKHLIARARILQALRGQFQEMKDDLSNFDSVMLRYKRRHERRIKESRDGIKNWLSQPNLEDDFNDWVKKWVGCLMLHGASPVYKEYANNDAYLENFYMLPGGTVMPLRSVQVGGFVAYVQIIMGQVPKFYYQDEMTFTNYMPSSARSYGYVPLDALVNKVAEQILFDRFAAARADGTKPPEKAVVFGENRSLFGNMTGEIDLPMPKGEQKRIEEKLNTARKEAIATLSGVGTPLVIDLSRADTFAAQSQRQNQLLRDTALAFGMTNMEINLAGGEFTSGKETSETQQEIEEGKGTKPIIDKIRMILNRDIMPYRWGDQWLFEYSKSLNEFEQAKLDSLKMQTGTYTPDEVREARGDKPILQAGSDQLPSQQGDGQAPGGNPFAPVYTQAVE